MMEALIREIPLRNLALLSQGQVAEEMPEGLLNQ